MRFKHRALEIELQHHAQAARQPWVHRDREVQGEDRARFEQFVERRKRPAFARAASSPAYADRGGQNVSCTCGLSSNSDRNTTMPSAIDERRRVSSGSSRA